MTPSSPWRTVLRTGQGRVGALLVAVFWPLNWFLPDALRATAYLFFPLWLGYILLVDAVVLARAGSSILSRSRRDFLLLFVISAPAWWLFEVINWRTRNWEYLGTEVFSTLEYHVLCTISFSTVMPAVFETAELAGTFRWMKRFANGPRVPASPRWRRGLFLIGVAWLALVLVWPRYFYPLVWGALVLMLEPINHRLGRRTLLASVAQGDWRPVASLSAGAMLCGFFWELWNYYSYPKWVYHTPGAEFWHVFEMPLLGYLGYLPFAWELFALHSLVAPGGAAGRFGRSGP